MIIEREIINANKISTNFESDFYEIKIKVISYKKKWRVTFAYNPHKQN